MQVVYANAAFFALATLQHELGYADDTALLKSALGQDLETVLTALQAQVDSHNIY